jgi:multidrug resistance efflux pump
MRFLLSLTAGTLLLCASAQSAGPHDAEDPNVARARVDIERMRALVEAGALPRAQLERAEDALGGCPGHGHSP